MAHPSYHILMFAGFIKGGAIPFVITYIIWELYIWPFHATLASLNRLLEEWPGATSFWMSVWGSNYPCFIVPYCRRRPRRARLRSSAAVLPPSACPWRARAPPPAAGEAQQDTAGEEEEEEDAGTLDLMTFRYISEISKDWKFWFLDILTTSGDSLRSGY